MMTGADDGQTRLPTNMSKEVERRSKSEMCDDLKDEDDSSVE
jgi:hypothetical protein